jgi:hypothetical protein
VEALQTIALPAVNLPLEHAAVAILLLHPRLLALPWLFARPLRHRLSLLLPQPPRSPRMLLAVAPTAAPRVQDRALVTAAPPMAGAEAHLRTAVQDVRQASVTALEAMEVKARSRPPRPVRPLRLHLPLAPRLHCNV